MLKFSTRKVYQMSGGVRPELASIRLGDRGDLRWPRYLVEAYIQKLVDEQVPAYLLAS